MSFASLTSLWWFAPLAGIIVALYLLKMRRRDVRVPASFLWPNQVTDVRANALFQKLRFSWLLLLQLLIIALIVISLARPQLLQRGLGGKVTVVVMDVSASMQATDEKPTRMATASGILDILLSQARPGDRVSLIEAGSTPRVVFSNSSDVAKMRRLVRELRPTDAEADVGEALRLASSIVNKQRGARIVLLSDGVFSEIEDFAAGEAQLVFQKVGHSGKNAAISALGVSTTGENRFLYAAVKNYGLDKTSGELRIFADGKLLDTSNWTAGPDQTIGRTIKIPLDAKVFEAKLEHPDFLESDNYAATVDDRGTTIRALLVSPGNLFLERALSLDPRVRLEKSVNPPQSGAWDLVVYDGIEEGLVEAKAVIAFGAAGRRSPVLSTGAVRNPTPVFSDPHPLLQSVDLAETFIDKAQKTTLKSSSKAIAEMESGGASYPLIATSNSGGVRRLYVAFAPLESDFPLQVAFPIFVANAIEYLLPPLSRNSSLSLVPGQNLVLPSSGDSELTVRDPAGKDFRVKPSHGRYVIREIQKAGTYKIGDRKAYASLRSTIESDISPVDRLKVAGESVQASANLAQLSDAWRYMLGFALSLLVLEWWVFIRRS